MTSQIRRMTPLHRSTLARDPLSNTTTLSTWSVIRGLAEFTLSTRTGSSKFGTFLRRLVSLRREFQSAQMKAAKTTSVFTTNALSTMRSRVSWVLPSQISKFWWSTLHVLTARSSLSTQSLSRFSRKSSSDTQIMRCQRRLKSRSSIWNRCSSQFKRDLEKNQVKFLPSRWTKTEKFRLEPLWRGFSCLIPPLTRTRCTEPADSLMRTTLGQSLWMSSSAISDRLQTKRKKLRQLCKIRCFRRTSGLSGSSKKSYCLAPKPFWL